MHRSRKLIMNCDLVLSKGFSNEYRRRRSVDIVEMSATLTRRL